MAAIFKSSLQNLSPLPTSLKVEPLAKPKTGLKLFVNTIKPKTKVLAVLGQKLDTKVSTLSVKPWLRHFVNMGPEHPITQSQNDSNGCPIITFMLMVQFGCINSSIDYTVSVNVVIAL